MVRAEGASNAAATLQCLQVWGDNRAVDNGVVMPGLDAWVYSRPSGADDAGGDVHYVSSCATGRLIRVLVADVSGHGVEVAEIAVRLRTLMRRYINHADQRVVLRDLNREFIGLAPTGRFATAVMITCWTPTGELNISCAGHPSPLRYDARTRRWSALFAPGEGADIPLGIDEPQTFGQTSVRLGDTDMLLLLTDGVIETRAASGSLIGQAGVLERLNTSTDRAPQEIVDSLVESLDAWRVGAPLDDDTTLLLLRPNALRPRGSMLTGLRAAARTAGGMLASLAGRGPAPMPEVNRRNILGAFFDGLNRRPPDPDRR